MGNIPPLHRANQPLHIWIHGASLGEAGVTESIVYFLQQHLSSPVIFTLSAFTHTGKALLEQRLGSFATVIFAPLDLPGWPDAAITARHPDAMIFVETEIWPNWIRACTDRGIPVLMVNGRISPRSFPRYKKIRPLLQETFSSMQGFSMISKADAERIVELGAPPEKIQVCGNIKRDPISIAPAAGQTIDRETLGLASHTPLLICGSIRQGEEIPLGRAFCTARKKIPNLHMILAPRHLKRLLSMEKNITGMNLRHQRRSSDLPLHAPVLFLDTMGELRSLYTLADVVFCGGSLVPAGGQNLLEAAACAKPVLFGPSMEDFSDEKNLLVEAGAAFEAKDADALAEKLIFLLSFPEKAKAAGLAGLAALQKNRGATACHVQTILDVLPADHIPITS
nr:glycosyltransferase N-terminal domain-containing protein [Desulfobotulus pelophilus]